MKCCFKRTQITEFILAHFYSNNIERAFECDNTFDMSVIRWDLLHRETVLRKVKFILNEIRIHDPYV